MKLTFATLSKLPPWVLAGLIVFWTWGPVRFRPQIGHPQMERFAAYLVLGALMAAAYPDRKRLVAAVVMVAAVGLEVGQLFVAGRDAGLQDALVKMAGGAAGVIGAVVVARLFRVCRSGFVADN